MKFTARSTGGHASAPAKNTPIARLAAFVNEVETHTPFKRKFLPEVSAMFARLAPYAPFGLKLVMGNLWLFAPIMKPVLGKISAQAGAMLQTTIAFTMQSGSDAYNVLPQEATLGANMRFIPHQGEKESLEIIKALAAKAKKQLTIVCTNTTAQDKEISLDLSDFKVKGKVKQIRTSGQFADGEHWAETDLGKIKDSNLQVTLIPNSVTTLVVDCR